MGIGYRSWKAWSGNRCLVLSSRIPQDRSGRHSGGENSLRCTQVHLSLRGLFLAGMRIWRIDMLPYQNTAHYSEDSVQRACQAFVISKCLECLRLFSFEQDAMKVLGWTLEPIVSEQRFQFPTTTFTQASTTLSDGFSAQPKELLHGPSCYSLYGQWQSNFLLAERALGFSTVVERPNAMP